MIPIKNNDLKELAKIHFESAKRELDKKGTAFVEEVEAYYLQTGAGLSFKEVITADFKTLKEHAAKYKISEKKTPVEEFIVENLYGCFAKSVSRFGGIEVEYKETKQYYNAQALIYFLGITVCPYCNRNYINNIEKENDKTIRTSQFDHFFNKKDYPLYAISFYNLVPSCYACNHTKSVHDISKSPYDSDLNIGNTIKFDFELKSALPLKNKSDVTIFISEQKGLEDNVRVLGLENQYELHKGDVYEILMRQHFFTDEMIQEYFDNYNSLFEFENENQLKSFLLGGYFDEKNIINTSLGKLKYDICTKLKNIK